jgi:hypothetical protein
MTDDRTLDGRDDVLVEEDTGSTAGTALGIVVIIGLLAAIWWFALGPGVAGQPGTRTDPNLVAPSPAEQLPSAAPSS